MFPGSENSDHGVVYTDTVVFSPPAQYAADAPYQLAIVDLASGQRRTIRIVADDTTQRVHIGDTVALVKEQNGVAYYRRTAPLPSEETAKSRGALA